MTPEAPRFPPGSVNRTGEGEAIALNGENRVLAAGTTVSALLRELNLPEDRVAVEMDGEILKRAKWSATEPRAGSRLEIVHFVGGG